MARARELQRLVRRSLARQGPMHLVDALKHREQQLVGRVASAAD